MDGETVTRVRINPVALTQNYRSLQDLVGEETVVAAVVKADAYGHGLETAAKAFHQAGCRFFCVAAIGEAARLRHLFGDDIRILKVVPSLPLHFPDVARLGVEEVLVSPAQRKLWAEWFTSNPATVRFHIKVDRGMGRLGYSYEELLRELIDIHSDSRFSIIGLMSHLPASEEDPETAQEAEKTGRYHTSREIRRFSELIQEVSSLLGGNEPICHIANSGAALFHPGSHFGLIRAGIALYGADPRGEDGMDLGLLPAMTFESHLVQVRAIPTGATIGYRREFVAPKPMIVGVVPVGYSDGFSWNLRNNAHVLVRGRRCPILGRISMNLVSVDLSECEGAQWGDPVVLLGRQGEARIGVEEIARRAGTIPYEILTGIGRLAANRVSLPEEEEATSGLES